MAEEFRLVVGRYKFVFWRKQEAIGDEFEGQRPVSFARIQKWDPRPPKNGDASWDGLVSAAEALEERAIAGGLNARAMRYTGGGIVAEGLWVGDRWTDQFEPVRGRPRSASTWQDIQPVREAVANIVGFLRDRPDLIRFSHDDREGRP
jgi:hypothetical protein